MAGNNLNDSKLEEFVAEDPLTKKFLDFFERRQIKPEPRIVDTIILPDPAGIDLLDKTPKDLNEYKGKKFDEDILCTPNTGKIIPQIIGLLLGLLIVIAGYFLLFDDTYSKTLVIAMGFVFAGFLGAKIQECTHKYIIKKGGIELRDLGAGKYIPWAGVREVKLRYAAKQFTLYIKDSMGISMKISGAVKKFDLIAACVAQAVRVNRIKLDELSTANFSTMGQLFSHQQFSNDELEIIRQFRGGANRAMALNNGVIANNNQNANNNNNAQTAEPANTQPVKAQPTANKPAPPPPAPAPAYNDEGGENV